MNILRAYVAPPSLAAYSAPAFLGLMSLLSPEESPMEQSPKPQVVRHESNQWAEASTAMLVGISIGVPFLAAITDKNGEM